MAAVVDVPPVNPPWSRRILLSSAREAPLTDTECIPHTIVSELLDKAERSITDFLERKIETEPRYHIPKRSAERYFATLYLILILIVTSLDSDKRIDVLWLTTKDNVSFGALGYLRAPKERMYST